VLFLSCRVLCCSCCVFVCVTRFSSYRLVSALSGRGFTRGADQRYIHLSICLSPPICSKYMYSREAAQREVSLFSEFVCVCVCVPSCRVLCSVVLVVFVCVTCFSFHRWVLALSVRGSALALSFHLSTYLCLSLYM